MRLRIRELREDNEKTQKELAQFLNVSREAYSRYETGNRLIPYEMLDKLADYYKTSIDYLIGKTNIRTPYPPCRAK